MPNLITNKKGGVTIAELIKEMRELKVKLNKFMGLIPGESIKEYKNSWQIKKDYLAAVKSYPPK